MSQTEQVGTRDLSFVRAVAVLLALTVGSCCFGMSASLCISHYATKQRARFAIQRCLDEKTRAMESPALVPGTGTWDDQLECRIAEDRLGDGPFEHGCGDLAPLSFYPQKWECRIEDRGHDSSVSVDVAISFTSVRVVSPIMY